MKRIINILLAVYFVCIFSEISICWAIDGDLGLSKGADGSEEFPWLIEDFQDFRSFCLNSDYWSNDVWTQLECDIDLSSVPVLSKSPIAGDTDSDSSYDGIEYNGVFQGNGYVISNLNVTGMYYCGLFGKIGNEAIITKLGLENINIIGDSYVGGLCGENNGCIEYCFVEGSIAGDCYIGGIAASLGNTGIITNSYFIGSVIGKTFDGYYGYGCYVGGLVGENSGDISCCYSSAIVNGGDFVGVSVGKNDGIVSDSYFYVYGGQNNSFGTGLDDGEIVNISNYEGFDFTGNTEDGELDIWAKESGAMPKLSWQVGLGYQPYYRLDSISTTLSGTGYPDDPFVITDYDDLMEFQSNSDLRIGYYILEGDIDLDGNSYTSSFINSNFCGSFNGNGHIISNLEIISTQSYYAGFFVRVCGPVTNLHLDNVSISHSGHQFAGGIAAYNSFSTISKCSVSGNISGNQLVGAISGANDGVISECYSNAVIECDVDRGGGITGDNWFGTVKNSYMTGSVSGNGAIGGIAGLCFGLIDSCYSAASVDGNGICGYCSNGGTIQNSFWDVETSGVGSSGTRNYGAIGKTTIEMNTYDTFVSAGWDFAGEMANGTEDVWIMDGYPIFCWQFDEVLGGGDGTMANPYMIMNIDDFEEFCSDSTYWNEGVYTKLVCDLDLSVVGNYSKAPIAWNTSNVSTYFEGDSYEGLFNGCGHVVRNLVIQADTNYVGLFGLLGESAIVRNIGMEGCQIYAKDSICVGGIAGYNYGTIDYCYVEGNVLGYKSVGGISGYLKNNGSITDCYCVGTIAGYLEEGNFDDGTCAGGIVGDNYGTISTSYSSASVNGGLFTGGVVGKNNGAIINDCYHYVYGGKVNGMGTALNDDDIIDSTNFSGFDFLGVESDGNKDIWAIEQGICQNFTGKEI